MPLDIGSLRIQIEANTKALKDAQKDIKNLTAAVKKGADVQIRSAQRSKKALTDQKQSVDEVTKSAKKAATSAEQLARAELRQAKALATARDKAKELTVGLKIVGGTKEDIAKVNSALGTFISSTKKAEGNTTKLARATFRFKENTKGAKKNLKELNTTIKKVERAKEAATALDRFNLVSQDLTKSVQLALGPLSGVASRITAFTALLNKNVFAVSLFIGAGVGFVVMLSKMIKEATILETQLLRLDFQVKAMGETFGFTTEELDNFAVGLGEATLASATGVREAIGVLLTFKDIVPNIFKRVIEVSQDMVDTIGGDLPQATRRLARALSDPKTGLEALTRSGITFTEQEKKLIEAFGILNEKGKQQEFILLKIESLMKGNAQAAARGLAGAVDTLGERFVRFLQEAAKSGGILAPITKVVNRVSGAIADLLDNQEAMIAIGVIVNKGVKFTTFLFRNLVDNLKFAAIAAAFFAGKAALGLLINILGKYKIVLKGVVKIQTALTALTLAHPFIIGGALIAAAIGGTIAALAKYTDVLDEIIKKGKEFVAKFDISGKIEAAKKKINNALAGIGFDPVFVGLSLPNFEESVAEIELAIVKMQIATVKYLRQLKETDGATKELDKTTKEHAKIIDQAAEVTEALKFAEKTRDEGLALHKKRVQDVLTPEALLEKQLQALEFHTDKLGVSEKKLAQIRVVLAIQSRLNRAELDGFNTKLVTVRSTTEATVDAAEKLNLSLKKQHKDFIITGEGAKEYSDKIKEAKRAFIELDAVAKEGLDAHKKAFETILGPMEAFILKQAVIQEGVEAGNISLEDQSKIIKGLSMKYRLLQASVDGFQITQFGVSSDMKIMKSVVSSTNAELKILFDRFRDGEIGAKAFNEESKKIVEKFEAMTEATKLFASTVASAFARAAIEGGKLSDVIANIGKQLFQAALQALIFRAITSGFGGGSGMTSQQSASDQGFVVQRALGGSLSHGQTSLVGERGPELFTPNSAGRITPNNQLGGRGNTVINIDARGATPGMEGRIAAAIRLSENRAVARARVSTRDDILRR